MKIKNKTCVLLLLSFFVTFQSCIDHKTLAFPQSLGLEENIELQKLLDKVRSGEYSEIPLKSLKDLFVQDQATEITSNLVVKGFVTSSDAEGNYYKEFYIQDNEENPKAAIKIATELTDIHNKYNVGREVYINLKGLYLGEVRSGDGVIAIGGTKNEDNEIENLSIFQTNNQVLRTDRSEDLVPLDLGLAEINEGHIGMYTRLMDVQFPQVLSGKTYVDASDQFDTHRTIETCFGFGFTNFMLETSTFAAFRFELLPTGLGSISGVISKTYNGSNLVLTLNNTDGVQMDQSRCFPMEISDFEILFEENFDEGKDNTDFDFPDWINYAEKGRQLWTEQVFRRNGYAEFSGYGTNDSENEAWLITPQIETENYREVYLNFRNAQHHLESERNKLEVLVSKNFDGINVLNADWMPLHGNLPNPNDTWYQFKDVGLIDLSQYLGKIHIGFKYTGSGKNPLLDGAVMIDELRIVAR
ncbi:MAG: hypothetical protein CMB99_10460 [Flavobacteriaceae bacterium]|nr:hypothetical protein [Flavobacteriaceae bacterium]|tara:strand:- start:241200 stop:242612 length:1413 start_codon:yes stop_codon:yes gene_type:complete